MSSFYRQQLERWLGRQEVIAERVLDVGGAQLPVKGRTLSWRADEYVILDLPEPHKGDPGMLTADLNLDYTMLVPYGFDVVFCLEVMEYVWNPAQACRNLAHWMRPGGILHITFPFVYPVHEPVADDSLRYTLAGACKLLEHSGLEVENVELRHTEKISMARAYAAEQMRAAKGFDHENVGFIITAKKTA